MQCCIVILVQCCVCVCVCTFSHVFVRRVGSASACTSNQQTLACKSVLSHRLTCQHASPSSCTFCAPGHASTLTPITSADLSAHRRAIQHDSASWSHSISVSVGLYASAPSPASITLERLNSSVRIEARSNVHIHKRMRTHASQAGMCMRE